MAVPLRIRRNPLAYPAGRTPGFNPAHVALTGGAKCRLSAVANGGNMIDVQRGLPGVIVGTPTGGIDGGIGPSFNFTLNSTKATKFTGPSTADTNKTWAAIFAPTSLSGGSLFCLDFGTGNYEVKIPFTSSTTVRLFNGTGTTLTLPVAIKLNTPYFFVVSFVSGSTINLLLLDMSTGQLQTATGTAGVNSGNTGSYSIGDDSFGESASAKVAAFAFTTAFLSAAQLLQWAADPWSFWYPNDDAFNSLVGTSSPAFLPDNLIGGSRLIMM